MYPAGALIYSITNGAITITGYTGAGGAVSIPSTINGLPVTSIGTNAFEGTSLTSVTIPASVTNIGEYAFWDCYSLTAITADPNNPAYSSVAGVLFDKGQTTLIQCPGGITGSYTIPASVTSIGDYAFWGCSSLTAITVDANNSVYSSVAGVLFDKSQTTLIQYPAGKAGSYTIPSSVTSIGDNAFATCFGLTNVTIPASVTSIGDGAFEYCYSLTSVTIGSSVTTIGDFAFYVCPGLTSVTIPASVTTIGVDPFGSCPLSAITVDPGNPAYSSVAGVLFDKSQTTLIEYPAGKAGSYTIPSSVTSIGLDAFWACTSLTSVTIPNSVTNIGDDAFGECISLTNVTIPNSVTSIGDYAFSYCTSLTSVTIGSSVSSIGDYVFSGCTSLTSIAIPNNVTSIGDYAFNNCTSLTAVYFLGNAPSSGSDQSAFSGDPNATACYVSGSTGWGTTFGGIPISLCSWQSFVTETVTVNLSQGGSVTGGGAYPVGSNVTVCASPNACYSFVNWIDQNSNVVSTSACYLFTAVTNETLVANFTPITYAVPTSSSPAGGGSTSGGGMVACGSSVTVCATANPCYSFVNWIDQNSNVVSTSACYTFTAVTNETLVANFTPITYAVPTSSSPAGGGTTSGGGTVACGSNVTVCASANACYSFVELDGERNRGQCLALLQLHAVEQ